MKECQDMKKLLGVLAGVLIVVLVFFGGGIANSIVNHATFKTIETITILNDDDPPVYVKSGSYTIGDLVVMFDSDSHGIVASDEIVKSGEIKKDVLVTAANKKAVIYFFPYQEDEAKELLSSN